MAISEIVSDAGPRLWRGIKRVGNWFTAENETPMVAFRDWLKIIISGAAIVALFLTTRQLGIQTGALVTQGEQLRIQKAAQRPWLKVDPPRVASAFPVGPDGGAFAIDFDVKNFGSSPALNVELDVELPMMKSGMGAGAIQESVCKRLRERPTGDKGGGQTLFPGNSISLRNVVPVQAGAVMEGVRLLGLSDHAFMPMMIGCARYFSPIDESQHETAFAFYVQHNPPDSFLGSSDGNIPADQVRFVAPGMLNSRIN
ncbi:hypothetical protein [Bradyrhizobium sp. RT5a]|uniref:hypothetical protein n=1 Tax=Bradyrhizobium sp. RT5a TaxID=3156380 RepID=UPI00339B7B0F